MHGERFFRNLVREEEHLVTDFFTWCALFAQKKGYSVFVDRNRVRAAHRDWCGLLARWSTSTVVDNARGGALTDERKSRFHEEVEGSFTETPLNNSHIKMMGSLCDCLLAAKPVLLATTFEKEKGSNVEWLTSVAAPYQATVDANSLLEKSPNEYLIFQYCWDRFYFVEANRSDKKMIVDPKNLPMTDHFEQNLISVLQAREFSGLALYMLFKAFDLFSMDHSTQQTA